MADKIKAADEMLPVLAALDAQWAQLGSMARGQRNYKRWIYRQEQVCAAVRLVAARAWAEGEMGRCLDALTLQKEIHEGLLKMFVAPGVKAGFKREGPREKAVEPVWGLQKQPDLSGLTDEQVAQLALAPGAEAEKPKRMGRPKGYPASGVAMTNKLKKQERLRREAEEATRRGNTESDVEADWGRGGAVQSADDGAFERLLRRVPADVGRSGDGAE